MDVPIQDQSQQLSIYKIFTLDIPHGNFTAHYDINTQYLRITQDETMAVEISPHQFSIFQTANGQFCNIITPFQPLANPPSFITALYTISANQENSKHQYTLKTCSQCIDINYTIFCSNYSCHTHLPRRNIKIYYNKEAHSHLAITPSLQCYIDQLPSTSTL